MVKISPLCVCLVLFVNKIELSHGEAERTECNKRGKAVESTRRGEHAYLQGSAARNGLIEVEGGADESLLVSEKVAHNLADCGDTGRATDEFDKLDLVLADTLQRGKIK